MTPPPALPSGEHRRLTATPDTGRATADLASSAADKPRADFSKQVSQPRVVAQQQPTVVAQRQASVQSSPVTPPVASPTDQHRVSPPTQDTNHAAADQTMSAADKLRADSSRYLKAARVSLKANNLSATKVRLAAALAAQPDNRDALRLRSTVHTLEQQRDALLSLARGCGYIGRWACTSRDAGIALQIDSSSKEAQRLATRAMRESALRIEPPADTAGDTADTVAEPLPDVRYLMAHH